MEILQEYFIGLSRTKEIGHKKDTFQIIRLLELSVTFVSVLRFLIKKRYGRNPARLEGGQGITSQNDETRNAEPGMPKKISSTGMPKGSTGMPNLNGTFVPQCRMNFIQCIYAKMRKL